MERPERRPHTEPLRRDSICLYATTASASSNVIYEEPKFKAEHS